MHWDMQSMARAARRQMKARSKVSAYYTFKAGLKLDQQYHLILHEHQMLLLPFDLQSHVFSHLIQEIFQPMLQILQPLRYVELDILAVIFGLEAANQGVMIYLAALRAGSLH